MPKIDYSQLIKEQIAPPLRSLNDRNVAICMHLFLQKLFFLSFFEAKEKPSDFSEHIHLWSLEPIKEEYTHYWSALTVKYLWSVDFPIFSNRLKSIGVIQAFLYELLIYRQIESLNIDDKEKQQALRAKVSPLVRKVLEDLQQYLLTKSSEIKKVYKAARFSYTELVTDVLQSLHTTQDATFNSAVWEFYSALSSIAKTLKSRSVGHFVDVISLCRTYPESDFFLPFEDWVDSAVLEDIKLVNSLLKNPDDTESNQATIALMYKTLETIESLCTTGLSETIAKYKKPRRSAVLAAANAKRLGLFAEPNQTNSFQERIALIGGLTPLIARLSDPDSQVQKNAALALIDLVKTADDLKNVLTPISSEQRDTVLDAVKDQLLALTSTTEDLESVLGILSEKEATHLELLRGQGGGFKPSTPAHSLFPPPPASIAKKKVSLCVGDDDNQNQAPAEKQAK